MKTVEPDNALLQSLRKQTSESRYLEWKVTPPFGKEVTLRTKYRMVKAAISFANTEGGFVIFGVDSNGVWKGFQRADLGESDPAMLVEIINGAVSPEINLEYYVLRHAGRFYPCLRVGPSPLAPHVTTKEVGETLLDGKRAVYLQKYAVYCRYGAKSDLATPAQFLRIIKQRVEWLREELVRRVKEVSVPTAQHPPDDLHSGIKAVRVNRLVEDSDLAQIRITRNRSESVGVIMHEEIDEAVFEDINKVLDTNKTFASEEWPFGFADHVYYRVYAEREAVLAHEDMYELLARTALLKVYGPSCFWVRSLPPKRVASLIVRGLEHASSSHMHLIWRLALLIGDRTSEWLRHRLEEQWGNHTQKPEFFYSFKKALKAREDKEPILVATQTSMTTKIVHHSILVETCLKDTAMTSQLLSETCGKVFKGQRNLRAATRTLDVLLYGRDLGKMDDTVSSALLLQGN